MLSSPFNHLLEKRWLDSVNNSYQISRLFLRLNYSKFCPSQWIHVPRSTLMNFRILWGNFNFVTSLVQQIYSFVHLNYTIAMTSFGKLLTANPVLRLNVVVTERELRWIVYRFLLRFINFSSSSLMSPYNLLKTLNLIQTTFLKLHNSNDGLLIYARRSPLFQNSSWKSFKNLPENFYKQGRVSVAERNCKALDQGLAFYHN